MDTIKFETEKDIQLLKAIARTGIITIDLLPYVNVSLKRLNAHVNAGNVEVKGTYMLYGTLTNIYTLTPKSKYRMSSEFLINPYKSDITQLEHDYALAKIYMYLPYEVKNTWVTETMLHMRYPHANKTTDAIYRINDKVIGVEVVTDSYSDNDIENKKDFIKKYCDDFIMVHTHRKVNYSL